MTSIVTNSAAMAAIQVLRGIDRSLTDTQRQVSTGLRIATASDNSAYWSIATTMRSDKGALSSVEDALGLGAAKTDTAYTAMESVVDVLGSVQARLVASKEDGVDKQKIQEELEQLKAQVVSIAKSASFNDVNWLDTKFPVLSAASTSVTAALVRNPDGVAVKSIDLKMAQTSLFNITGNGILQKEVGIATLPPVTGSLGGLGAGVTSTPNHYGHSWFTFSGAGALGSADTITLSVTLDRNGSTPGTTYPVIIDQALVNAALGKSDGSINDATEMAAVLDAALAAQAGNRAGSGVGGYNNPGVVAGAVDIGSEEMGALTASSVQIDSVSSTLPGGFAFGMESSWSEHNNSYAAASFSFDSGLAFGPAGVLPLDFTMYGSTPNNQVITRADVDAALGTTDGIVDTPVKMAAVLNHVLAASGITASAIASSSVIGLQIDETIWTTAGTRSTFTLAPPTPTDITEIGLQIETTGIDFDFVDINVVSGDIDRYIDGLQKMLQKAISGASVLGSLSRRISLQTEFSARFSDSIASGVGRLVDADMNEASTRLKALQTRSQLANQSLNIANANPDNILSLFH